MVVFGHASGARKVKLMSQVFRNEVSGGLNCRPEFLDRIITKAPAVPADSGWMRVAS
jgi:hypothetical protein